MNVEERKRLQDVWKLDKGRKYFVIHEKLPIDEEQFIEFKMHTCMNFFQLPNNCKDAKLTSTKQAISRCLCGFLNYSHGGVLYCGVDDNAAVRGCDLSFDEVKHVKLSIRDTFLRFSPPVPDHLYKIEVFPVALSPPTEENVAEALELSEQYHRAEDRLTSTHVTLSDNCSCAQRIGVEGHLWVIKITIFPIDTADPRNADIVMSLAKTKIPKLFESEESVPFFRQKATVPEARGDLVKEHVERLLNSVYERQLNEYHRCMESIANSA